MSICNKIQSNPHPHQQIRPLNDQKQPQINHQLPLMWAQRRRSSRRGRRKRTIVARTWIRPRASTSYRMSSRAKCSRWASSRGSKACWSRASKNTRCTSSKTVLYYSTTLTKIQKTSFKKRNRCDSKSMRRCSYRSRARQNSQRRRGQSRRRSGRCNPPWTNKNCCWAQRVLNDLALG